MQGRGTSRTGLGSTELEGQIKMEEMCFCSFLKMAKDLAARIDLGRSFHQMGTVNLKVCESGFVALWDGTIKRQLLQGS